MVRAKMKCEKAELIGTTAGTESVQLRAVYDGSDENKQWAIYTPAGVCALSIDNPAAQGKFEVGKEYFIDISPA